MAASRVSSRRALQALGQVGSAGEQHPVAVLDERQAEGGGKMALADAGWADEDHVGAFVEPAVAGTERHEVRLGEHRHGVEVEGIKRLAVGQLRLAQMALEAAPRAVGDLVLGEGGEQASGRPAFAVGGSGELRPQRLDGGQAQLVEHEVEGGGGDWLVGVGMVHAAPA